jgi:transcriptional regulator GlxA family with amidase domain
MDATRIIACLVYPGVMSLDVTGPMQVFASANVERQRQGLPPHYELRLIGETAGPFATSAGLKLVADAAWSNTDPATLDTLLVPGAMA